MQHLFAFIFLLLITVTQTNAASSNVANTFAQSWTGKASYYGEYFHGKKTANGEIYNQNKLTAAHNSYPFGTYVCLTNTDNGKTVRVKINDRGGFSKYGRSFDLSKEAARQLDFVHKGTCKVTYRVCN